MNAYDKMREALEAVLYNWTEDGFGFIKESTIEAVKQALAAPRRNCDVGTAEEQAQRFYKFCMANSSAIVGMCDSQCPCLDSGDKCHCLTIWAQLLYEEGGDK